jgi:hypothetical protein
MQYLSFAITVLAVMALPFAATCGTLINLRWLYFYRYGSGFTFRLLKSPAYMVTWDEGLRIKTGASSDLARAEKELDDAIVNLEKRMDRERLD